MNILDKLEEQYQEIDDYFSKLEFEARTRGWNRKVEKYKNRRKTNDQAYFLFIFTRLEDKIREESAKLIQRKKRSISSWRQRAAWDLLPSQPSANLRFQSRLALLREKGGSDFNLVVEYYKERNSIAHGGEFIKPINMPTEIAKMKRIYGELKA
jgi:hypothetical protein